MKDFLKLKNINLTFGKEKILDGLNLSINKGQFIAITGVSGSGKTSLLRIICGLEKPNDGEVHLDNNILLNDKISIPTEKRNIGLVIQEKVLFPHLNVKKNIEFGISTQNNKQDISKDMMEKLNILDLQHTGKIRRLKVGAKSIDGAIRGPRSAGSL